MFPPEDLLRSVARAVETVDSTAPSIDEVAAAVALDQLSRAIVEHNRRLFAGETIDWAALSHQFDDAHRTCWLRLSTSSGGGQAAGNDRSRAGGTRRPTERPDTSPIYG